MNRSLSRPKTLIRMGNGFICGFLALRVASVLKGFDPHLGRRLLSDSRQFHLQKLCTRCFQVAARVVPRILASLSEMNACFLIASRFAHGSQLGITFQSSPNDQLANSFYCTTYTHKEKLRGAVS